MFVHVADGRVLRDILRGGIRPSRLDYARYAPEGWPARRVFCVPVLPGFEATFQWVRELRRWAPRCVAVQFRLPDEERVLVGAFWQEHRAVAAAESAAVFLRAEPATRGLQVLVPRGPPARDRPGPARPAIRRVAPQPAQPPAPAGPPRAARRPAPEAAARDGGGMSGAVAPRPRRP